MSVPTQDRVYVQSAGHKFNGGFLEPFTPSRFVAAQSMGMKYPFIGKEGMAALNSVGIYPGELRDLLIVLWLCSQKEDDEILQAQIDGKAAYRSAEEWGAKLGLLNQVNDLFTDGVLVLHAIFAEIHESKTEPKSDEARAPASTGLATDESPND